MAEKKWSLDLNFINSIAGVLKIIKEITHLLVVTIFILVSILRLDYMSNLMRNTLSTRNARELKLNQTVFFLYLLSIEMWTMHNTAVTIQATDKDG